MRHQHAILKNKRVVPCTFLEWAEWSNEDPERRIIKRTYLHDNAFMVSTVFLGLNHGFGGVPLWFETMIFPKNAEVIKGTPFESEVDFFQTRARTYSQSLKGHQQAIDWLESEVIPHLK